MCVCVVEFIIKIMIKYQLFQMTVHPEADRVDSPFEIIVFGTMVGWAF